MIKHPGQPGDVRFPAKPDVPATLEARLELARRLTAEPVVRAYRLYLAFSALGFEQGWMSLHQVLASRPSGRPEDGPMRGAQSAHPFQRDHFALNGGTDLPLRSRG